MRAVAIDIDFLKQSYFPFDDPVPYKVDEGEIMIRPISIKNSEIFLTSVDILGIDKNSLSDVKIIQMSYLQFIIKCLLSDENSREIWLQKLINILVLCLGFKKPKILWDKMERPFLFDDILKISVTAKQFEEIKRIIMYQNIPNYNDDYVNPELKKAMAETDYLKNRDKTIPSLERKMAIITAHCGLSKKEQMEMSYRSHCILFDEVCGEIEYMTSKPVAIYTGQTDKIDHWIFKKKKNKFDGYVQSVDSYQQSMGGAQAIKSTDTSLGDSYMQQLENFQNN